MGERGRAYSPAMVDFESNYEIGRVAHFIHTGKFAQVALQFPDELLKDSTRVVSTLREKLRSLRRLCSEANGDVKDIGLYVMADTTYGSCCVDEVGASHINADCVIHYGHTCLSPTTKLPALFVFGKSSVSAPNCAKSLCNYASTVHKPILVLFGLEYAHAIEDVKEASMVESANLCDSISRLKFHFADVMCSAINPSENSKTCDGDEGLVSSSTANEVCEKAAGSRYKIGGLTWNVPDDCKIEDYALFWIGSDGPAFANVVLTFNGCEIVRYDAIEDQLLTDFSQQKRILKRRYYLVEKAKDAAIVGILVGTLGVAGYLSMIHQMKELITGAGKKAYTLVMGRPNPAKLANFPECDVFIYVSCAQTALLDSKEFLAPVITPFEAILAFNRGSQWTGEYIMEFQDLISPCPVEVDNQSKEARFSFLRGGYVEDSDTQEGAEEEDKDGTLALAHVVEKALQVRDKDPRSIYKSTANSGAEFLAARSYQGLDINGHSPTPEPFFIGRTGKASGYDGEKSAK